MEELDTPLTGENVMIRHEDGRLSVTLVNLKRLNIQSLGPTRLRPGKYHVVFECDNRIEFSVTNP